MSAEDEVIEQEEAGEVEQPEVEEDTPEEVEEASRIGWTTKDRFKGAPEKWISAKEFLRRGEESLPLLKAELRRTRDRLDAVEKSSRAFAEHHKKTEEAAYKRALESLRKERAEAISSLDGERVNEIDDKIDELRNNKPQSSATPEPPQFFADWLDENKWVQDVEGQAIAEALAAKLSKQHPELVGKREILDKVTEEARRKYPALFPELTNPRRTQPAAVASGSSARVKAKKTLADLPADARKEAADFIKRGYLTEAQYLQDYFGEQA